MSISPEKLASTKSAQSGLSDTLKRPIVFDGTATPVKTALFLIICVAWLFPGLIGHDPWKPDEAIAMGIVYSMLSENTLQAWLLPQIAGAAVNDYAPLYYWVSAVTAKLFSFVLPMHDGARLASGVFMAITLVYVYKSANKLFDERAGRIAVALFIGSLGLLLRAHEMNPELAGLAGMSVAIYGLTQIRFEARKGAVTAATGAFIIALSVGFVQAMIVPVAAIAMMAILHDWRNTAFRRGIGILVALFVSAATIYPAILAALGLWSTDMLDAIFGTPMFDVRGRASILPWYLTSILPWYALPTFPIAIWLWRKDRHVIRERIELALPIAVFVSSLIILSLLREGRDAVGLVLLLPLALASANSLDRLPKGVASFIDWFGLIFFGAFALAIWLHWSAAILGTPEAVARAVAQAAPGFEVSFNRVTFTIAALLTSVWLYAVVMAHRNNRRAIVNWAGGITLIWVLLNLLGLPAVDHVRTYRQPVSDVAVLVKQTPSCVVGLNIGEPQRAMFDYFQQLRFIAPNAKAAPSCDWMLTQGTKANAPEVSAEWTLRWEGARPAERVEQFRLYQRSPE
ncbi:MAG: glycosyltransferase family 39 protein [Aeromicrobium sp.]|nr:glycosyltransferase family 39 protein [Burkholderiales bacterium]